MNGHHFKALLKRTQIIRSVGAHDVFSALLADEAGIETIFMGGFGASASLLGQPDLELLTLTEMARAARKMAGRIKAPLIVDGDTGHGGVHNVVRTVQEFEAAGASGVILEDQVSPKRCGHFEGKAVISAFDMVTKLKAAQAARRNPDFIIVARTDARDVHGLKEAIRRVNLYRRAGADVVFVESPRTEEELRIIPKQVKGPILVNMLTGGKTPNLPVPELQKMGYKIVVYPIESLLITAESIRRLIRTILSDGSIDSTRHEMTDFSDIKNILGLTPTTGR